MTNGVPLGTAKDVVYRVVSSDPSKTLELGDGTVLKGTVRLENLEGVEFGDKGYLLGECCAWVKDIVPIPLTPEILEKNGWKKEVMNRGVKNSHWVYTKPDIEEYGYFPIYIEKGISDEFDVYPFTDNNDCKQIAYIKYVHQLQHLLFGLGLNSEMEVQVMAKCPFNKYKECQESDSRYCYCTLPCDVYNNYKDKLLT